MRSVVALAKATLSSVVEWARKTLMVTRFTKEVGSSMGAEEAGVFLTTTPGRTSTSGRSASASSSTFATTNTSSEASTLRRTVSRRFSITLSRVTFISTSREFAVRPVGACAAAGAAARAANRRAEGRFSTVALSIDLLCFNFKSSCPHIVVIVVV